MMEIEIILGVLQLIALVVIAVVAIDIRHHSLWIKESVLGLGEHVLQIESMINEIRQEIQGN